MAVVETAVLQRRLDVLKRLGAVGASLRPDVPLFMDQPGLSVVGGTWDLFDCGTLVVHGLTRGLISDDHWTDDGFDFMSDCYITGKGGQWDLGPTDDGWPGVHQLGFTWAGKLGTSGTWADKPIAGLSADTGGSTLPRPWLFATRGATSGNAMVAVTTTDDVVRKWFFPLSNTAAWPTVTFDVDLTDGDVTVLVDNSPVSVDSSQAGTGFNVSLGLKANSTHNFGLGWIPPWANNEGYAFSGDWDSLPDWELTRFEMRQNGSSWGNMPGLGDTRVETYPGGSSLPIIRGGPSPSKWLYILDREQVFSSGHHCLADGVTVAGRSGNPAVLVGPCQGRVGFTLANSFVEGGTRGVCSFALGVTYPLAVVGTEFRDQEDCAAWLWRCTGLTLDRVHTAYPPRCLYELWDCEGSVHGATKHAPPGEGGQEAAVIQFGGSVAYRDQHVNYESAPFPEAFLKVVPWSADSDGGPTEDPPTSARVSDCDAGNPDVLLVTADRTGYDGPTRVFLDNPNPLYQDYDAPPGVEVIVTGQA